MMSANPLTRTRGRRAPRAARVAAAGWLAVATIGLVASVAVGRDQPQPQSDVGDLQQRVRQAYADTRTYLSDVTFRTEIEGDRRTRTMWSTLRVAYDAQRPAVYVDRPGALLVADGQRLYLSMGPLKDKHLDMPMPEPLDFGALFDLLPGLHEPMLPDLVMLLSDDPLLPLAGWWRPDRVEQVPAAEAPDGRPRLRISTQQGLLTLILDPQSLLVVESVLEIDPSLAQLPPGQTARHRIDIDIKRHNEPLPADAFAWEAEGQPVASVEALFESPGQPQASQPPHPLLGQPTPPLTFLTPEGERFQIADVPEQVIVLDFWATWCMPCRMWMPQLSEIQQWANANGKSVKIISISVDADEAAAREFWKQHRYALQLALPEDQQAVSAAYGPVARNAAGSIVPVPMPLPYTVIVHNGKVVDFHQGVVPQMRDQLKDQIDTLLEQGRG